MYAVFKCTMLTDMGKTFICKFESTANAQATYKAMMEYSQESAPGKHRLQHHPCSMSHLPASGMDPGVGPPAHSFSTGSTKSSCTRSSLTPRTTSKMVSNWSCSKMRSMIASRFAMSRTPPSSWRQSVRSKQLTKNTPTYSWPSVRPSILT